MKKRVIALMLAFVLVLNMGTVAFANGEATPAPVTETEPTPTQEVEATLTPAPIAEAPSPVAEVIPTPTSEVVLESISVTQTPDKLEYLCTDTVVDSTGGLLTLTFSDHRHRNPQRRGFRHSGQALKQQKVHLPLLRQLRQSDQSRKNRLPRLCKANA